MKATPATPDGHYGKPLWCGSCDKRTRLVLVTRDPDNPARDFMVRCELCHPHDGRADCGKHIQPPGVTCGLCEHGIPGRYEREDHPRPDSTR